MQSIVKLFDLFLRLCLLFLALNLVIEFERKTENNILLLTHTRRLSSREYIYISSKKKVIHGWYMPLSLSRTSSLSLTLRVRLRRTNICINASLSRYLFF